MSLSAYTNQLLVRILPQALGLGVGVALKRLAGLEAFGLYSLAIALGSVTFGVASSAIDLHALRSTSARLFYPALKSKLLIWLLLAPLAAFGSLRLGVPLWGGLTIYCGLLLLHLNQLNVVFFRLENTDARAIAPSSLPPLFFLLALLIIGPKSFSAIALLFLAAWSISICFLFKPNFFSGLAASKWSDMTAFIRSSVPLGISIIFTQLLVNVDLFMLNYYYGSAESGLYRLAVSFSAVLMPAIGAFSYVYLSQIGDSAKRGDFPSVESSLKSQLRLNILLGSIFFSGIAILLPYLMPFLYGEDTYAGLPAAILLCAGAVFNALGTVFSYTLLAFNRDFVTIVILAIGSAINIMANALIIPRFGIEGAAWVSLLTQIFVFAANAFIVFRLLKWSTRPSAVHHT
ncbi:hypothetical protein D3C72_128840 [compost metagenome]